MKPITTSPFRRRRLHSFAAMMFAGALALSACGTGDSPQATNGDGPETPPPETDSTTDTVAAMSNDGTDNAAPAAPAEPAGEDVPHPLGNPDTAPKQHPAADGSRLEVTDVRVATHDGFDRVVFDTAGAGSPGWHVDYTEDPHEQATALPVEFDGTMALQVMVSGVTEPVSVPTVPGAGGAVTEVIGTNTHHGQSQYIIGMNDILPYSVQVLEEPQRVVVDILHEPDDAVAPIGNPDTGAKTQESGPPHQRVISDVRLATHDGFDRIVFDTVGEGAAGWFTGYTAEPVELASGRPVEFDGTMALEVNLTGMSLWTDEGHEQPELGTVPGAGGAVNEVVSTLTHHGQSQFIIGMDDVLPHSINLLEEPHRVVVDILHS